ncbi:MULTISPECIES: hypothetical protein [Brevibacillus]|uniref:hypothetical protein n=1 Tax=Brevibacillus TaxID=55080 RepID=UPI0012DCD198|nr:hypothetical protein [Brevibacillus borstelensis]MBE5396353.1 hypothetical protein [Brevibacillus borstelensis]MCC0567491.1 hypothetical protein [Brevibacillus borstelensis]MCM3472180.1 hypothetical protein [Brevibacillus borstelensis]MCM3560451.1 hypothetical protein [Brevibacillus borstelensis]MCM3592595.1 hypothetical protein [Brevibacillus borstelensis]
MRRLDRIPQPIQRMRRKVLPMHRQVRLILSPEMLMQAKLKVVQPTQLLQRVPATKLYI